MEQYRNITPFSVTLRVYSYGGSSQNTGGGLGVQYRVRRMRNL